MAPRSGTARPGAAGSRGGLTPREQEILRCLATGRTARAMGRQLGVSEYTVRKHLENVYTKMGVHDRLDAVLVGMRDGII